MRLRTVAALSVLGLLAWWTYPWIYYAYRWMIYRTNAASNHIDHLLSNVRGIDKTR